MTGLPEIYGARRASDVPWDRTRERRVLDGALGSWRRRARRMRALELSGAALMIVLLGRVLVRAAARSEAVASPMAVPEVQLEPTPPAMTPPVECATPRTSSAVSGGFAGTGGHGGARSTGFGGSAGTG